MFINTIYKEDKFDRRLAEKTCYLHFCYYHDALFKTYVVNNIKLTSVMQQNQRYSDVMPSTSHVQGRTTSL